MLTSHLKINLFLPQYSWKIIELALSNNHSVTLTEIYDVHDKKIM